MSPCLFNIKLSGFPPNHDSMVWFLKLKVSRLVAINLLAGSRAVADAFISATKLDRLNSFLLML